MKIAVFDFDRTLFPKDTIPYLMKQWYKLKYSRFKVIRIYISLLPAYVVYKLGIGNKKTNERLRLIAVNGFNNLFMGLSKDNIEEFFTRVGDNIIDMLNEQVVNELKNAQKNGFHTVIISGAYLPLLNYIAKNLNVDTILGTEICYTQDGIYDHNKGMKVINGDEKAFLIKETFPDGDIDWDNSYAYSDSIRDIDLLNLVGNPVVVNPDQELSEIAKNSKWRTI
ncbi:haloacid dehalogenase-like hydrolase [Mycoplasmatota bacterium]|nr:haloacid dehalogenase-like hydrolase [Mycoplasmatota bacterium]